MPRHLAVRDSKLAAILIGPLLRKRRTVIDAMWRPHHTIACKYLWRWHASQR